MKPEWITYLESIGIEGVFLGRVKEVLDFYQQVYPDQIEDIFITEYIDNEGNRQYESMWLFSETSIMEAKQFLNEHDFDSGTLKQQVNYWSIKKTEFDFHQSSTSSRMVLHFRLLSQISGTLKASKENCDHLKTLFSKHIIPNAVESPVATQ